MLARLLRTLYLFQLTLGTVLGGYLAQRAMQQGDSAWAWLWLPAVALGVPLLLQVAVLAVSMLRARNQGSPWPLWWRAFAGELRAALQVFLLRQPFPVRSNGVQMPLASGQTPGQLPVLLVHGYLCNHRVWDEVALALRKQGHAVLAVDLEPLFTSIDDYAALLNRQLDTLLAQTGAPQAVLVGHSMGGLAIRAWLRAYGSQRAARILTLGTPHQGTRIASASATANGAQMVWHSGWLADLAASEDAAQRALMHLAITEQDNIVFPQAEQVLPGAQVTRFSGIGHLQMCLDAGVIDWVCQQANLPGQPVDKA
ncbi:MAG: hypothetical protein AUJ20_05285 [Comamonadaceae bacterium CG1_02_60_18]|nr:MAG: hypothetical protein AUJ20_05285 [Comamonadaceae bacterium CG1_02_60_18]PIQ53891.1 MAG: hypothetical protein COW02_06035 [Comamonadaceae bacterium CG12_big_fil_rev_8_21_14_0_65_59_15]